VLASGARLSADFIVLATGSAYPFPAKSDHVSVRDAIADYRALHGRLAAADRVMLLGAGAVGLELAGEIANAWPDKKLVLVDVAEEILPGGYDPRLRAELGRQLDELGVDLVLGGGLTTLPDVPAGELGSFTAITTGGVPITADLWLRSHGVAPNTGYLAGSLAAARTADGYLSVTPELRVSGFDAVFALGDIAAIDTNKAGIAGRQAQVVAANIRAHLGDGEPVRWAPAPTSIILPLGPSGGAGQMAGRDDILTAEHVSEVKGRDMFVDRYTELFNVRTPAA
jgi:NADH dehydrogenase FAD-containing subunit